MAAELGLSPRDDDTPESPRDDVGRDGRLFKYPEWDEVPRALARARARARALLISSLLVSSLAIANSNSVGVPKARKKT